MKKFVLVPVVFNPLLRSECGAASSFFCSIADRYRAIISIDVKHNEIINEQYKYINATSEFIIKIAESLHRLIKDDALRHSMELRARSM